MEWSNESWSCPMRLIRSDSLGFLTCLIGV